MSGKRKEILVKDEVYHVFNKTIGSEVVFNNKIYLRRVLDLIDFYRFVQTLSYSKYKKLKKDFRHLYLKERRANLPIVEIYSYCFMPNHFHLLIKQLKDNGISSFLANIQNSFAKYYNLKNDRQGSLFIKPFKSKHIDTDEIFLHVSRYIHLNPVTSYLIDINELDNYNWTSFSVYAGVNQQEFVNTNLILKLSAREDYTRFVKDQSDYQRELGKLKNYSF